MKFKRSAGVLLHPTSLPGPFGIGDIGPQTHKWLEFLASTGAGLWQVLPLGPTGYGDSPYQSFSAFAGNPYLISPEALLEDGFLEPGDLENLPYFPAGHVDFGNVISWKLKLLDRAFEHFEAIQTAQHREALAAFETQEAHWLPDFALFMAIKEAHGGVSWSEWPLPLKQRKPEVLEQARQEYASAIRRQIFRQWVFFRQWDAVHEHARELGINIIGDIPIFVAHDSSDVWANTQLFYMDRQGNPTVVAGVPPDYFSPTGQLWGNPLYKWDVHARSGYEWWLNRFRAVLRMVDLVRLDHFRGFAGYWEVPAGNPTAEIGQWVPGPAKDFFEKVREALGELPIIAEDLGVITPDVTELREAFDLPSMKVLQFAFLSGPEDTFMPHNYPVNCVAYTGTHDNDTSVGWFKSIPEPERQFYRDYLARGDEDPAWIMMRTVWGTVAMFALAPMQDLLRLGSEARMNFPGRPAGNWGWRMRAEDMNEQLAAEFFQINHLYYRKKDNQ